MTQQRIAITGGIASGKSTVARLFQELGATILDADQLAREAVEPGTPGFTKLKAYLGDSYFDELQQLNRPMLRDRIIRDSRCRQEINGILHPFIITSMESHWKRCCAEEPGGIVLFDIPLLFEVGLDAAFDIVILVFVPPEIQVTRLMKRDGLSHEKAWETLGMQLPITSKKEKSHIVIDNSGSLQETKAQVKRVWQRLSDKAGRV